MNLNDNIRSKIKEMFESTDDNVHGVSLGHKLKGGSKTGEISIIFRVLKKLPKEEVPAGKMLPTEIEVDGVRIKTDVQESSMARVVGCYSSEDPNIKRLQPVQSGESMLYPMRGGQEIIMFPRNWAKAEGQGYNIEVGTLGFFCVDEMDGRTVGITNAHVVVDDYAFCSERQLDWVNMYDPTEWINGSLYEPGAVSADADNPLRRVVKRIKRYSGASLERYNYIDSAVLMMDPSAMDSNSHKMWGPIGVDPFSSPMPFATTQEIDSLLTTNPRMFSTGRTTGPKGFEDSPSCNLRVLSVGEVEMVGHPTIGILEYADIIAYAYEDMGYGPCLGGDSGSALVALLGSTYKIIGQVFAGNGEIGFACRIDRIVQEMKIRAWDGSLNKGTGSETNLGELVLRGSDQRCGQTSFVHTDGHTYWQVGSRMPQG